MPKKVLYVDDDKDLVNLIRLFIEQMGHSFIRAQNPTQAIGILHKGGVDLVITDFDLNCRVFGTDLFYMIRELGYDIPVILVSGTLNLRKDPRIDPEIWGLLSKFLEKPFTKSDFQAAIAAALKSTE